MPNEPLPLIVVVVVVSGRFLLIGGVAAGVITARFGLVQVDFGHFVQRNLILLLSATSERPFVHDFRRMRRGKSHYMKGDTDDR